MAEAAERQVIWVEKQFWATIAEIALLVFVVGVSSWAAWEAGGSAVATARGTDIANKQYLSTHRPRIVVRRTNAHDIGPNKQTKATITVVNIGPTEATIVGFGGRISTDPEDKYNQGRYTADLASPIRLQSGERRNLGLDPRPILNPSEWGAIVNTPGFLFMIGEIAYTDPTGAVRHTGFHRLYYSSQNRFIRDEKSEFEYED